MVAGGDPRRGRGIGGYLHVQGTFPRRLVLVVVAGEYHVDDELCSGGRRLGWLRDSSERAAKDKLMLALAYWVLEGVTDGVWAPETAGANRGGGRGGSGRPELGEETSSRSSGWLGRALVRCRGGACSRVSSGALFIGSPRRWP